ncbi:MAG: hypothetical protein N3A61_09855 [Ignavibacteria bacterium]|nr:hypothetical protein [Ignavibacteria bacterium]
MEKFFKSTKYIFVISLMWVFISCEHGIAPKPELPKTGFGGKIIFKNQWPKDIFSTRVVAFRDTIKTPADFNIFNIVYVSDSIPYGVGEFNYSTETSRIFPPNEMFDGVFKYICVAQSIIPGEPLVRDAWRVAGIYYSNGDTTKYGSIEVKKNTFVKNVDIKVDFQNPPVQPPK